MYENQQIGTYNRKVKGLIADSTILDEQISCFETVRGILPIRQISMRQWIEVCINPTGSKSLKNRGIVEQYRNNGNKELKKTLPAICPGAVMISRQKDLPIDQKIKHITGLMQFDIDPKDNPHIKDWPKFRDQLKNIVFVAFCSLSASGKGIWGLVKVKYPNRYREHFEQLKIDFASRNIFLDETKGGNPTDLRVYSYDPQAYIAGRFSIYDRLYKVLPKQRKVTIPHNGSDTRTKVERLIQEIQNRNIDIAPDYETYRNLGFAFASEFGEGGRDLFHAVCSPSPKYNETEAEKHYSSWLKAKKHGITIGTFFFLCKQSQIDYKK